MLRLAGLLCALSCVVAVQHHLDTVYEWETLHYHTPEWYPKKGAFKATQTFIRALEITDDRIFFTVPELTADNPASLVYVPRHSHEKDPHLHAYPGWEWHAGGVSGQPHTNLTCHGFISVSYIRLDKCGRLWALDSGVGAHHEEKTLSQICPPKLVAFDLEHNHEVRRIVIKKEVMRKSSLLFNFVIDNSDESGHERAGRCDGGHIFISDQHAPALVTVDLHSGKMWRHTDRLLYPEPRHGIIKVADKAIVAMAGISGMALSPPNHDTHRYLFFNSVASKTVYAVSATALKKRPNPVMQLQALPIKEVFGKPSQSLPLCFDVPGNALLFSPMTEAALMSYNFADSYVHILNHDPEGLQWVTDIRVDHDDNIWVVSTRMQNLFFGTLNPHEINQRVMRLNRNPQLDPLYGPTTQEYEKKK